MVEVKLSDMCVIKNLFELFFSKKFVSISQFKMLTLYLFSEF